MPTNSRSVVLRSLRRSVSLLAAGALAAAGLAAAAGPAGAVNGTGAWGTWSNSSSTVGAFALTSAGFPATAAVGVASASLSTATSTVINANTPPGQYFGASTAGGYALITKGVGAQPGQTSTTTITFAAPTPASGWGIVLGDVDAENVTITAKDASGAAVSASGWFNQGFNYCVTPKPSGCAAGTQTDQPTWNAATSTVMGSGTDTSGAAAWLTPTAAIKTLTLTQTVITGGPAFQVWIVSNVNTAPLGGTCSANTPFQTTVAINCAAVFVDPEDGAKVTVGPLAGPTNGTASVSNGVVTYTPNKGFSGTDTITIPVIDSMGASGTVTVTIVVRPDESPVVIPPGGSGPIDVVEIAGGGPGATVDSVEKPANGTAVIEGNVVIYTPDAGFAGSDSVTAVVKKADGSDVSVTVSVFVGKAQEPLRPLGLPSKVKKSGTTVLLDHRVTTNAGQVARAHVSCVPLLRGRVTGDVKPCVVHRSGGQVSVTTSGTRVSVTLQLTAPEKGAYSEYASTHAWISKK